MKARRIFRANPKTAKERVREQTLRKKLQVERPSLEDLVRDGECDPDAVMTMGMYFDVQRGLQALKRERKRFGLSIAAVAERSGLDRAVVSRLDNGKQDNPTIATLMRYAAAIGKRFLWSYEDLATKAAESGGKTAPDKADMNDQLVGSLALDAIQVLRSTQEQLLAHYDGRGVDRLAQTVDG